jgi:glutaredoxin
MFIELHLYDKFDKTALDILKLLDDADITFSVCTYSSKEPIENISKKLGSSIKRLPAVFVDGEKIGRYYDLVEFLVSKGYIDYQGKRCQVK